MSFSSEYNFYVSETEQIWRAYQGKYGKGFSVDGILNPHEYFESGKLKVMFILMENYNEGTWNIIDEIENTQVMYKDPNNVSPQWAPNILRTLFYTRDNQWVDFIPNYDIKGTGFAYLNPKKLDEGKYHTDYNDLSENVNNDKELLKRQIIACTPDIVFCAAANNYDRLVEIMDAKEETRISTTSVKAHAHILSYKVKDKEKRMLAIQWFHPSHQTGGWSTEAYKGYIEDFRPWFKPYSRI